MRLTFLGTAAAEGYPALWCRCERCRVARQRGGRNLRFRSSLLINDDLLIDPGPDTVTAAIRLGLDLAPVQAALVTHPHSDHLEATTFYWRRKGFVGTPLPVLHVYASPASLARLTQHEGRAVPADQLRVQPHPLHALEQVTFATGGPAEADPRFVEGGEAGAGGEPVPETPPRRYEVWTLAARHAEPAVEPMFFAVRQAAGPEAAGRPELPAVLYATDTGPFPDETWAALDRLAAEGLRFGATAIDSTSGLGADSTGHMSLRQMEAHQRELGRRGLLAEGAHLLAHHFSHNGTPPYEELAAHLAERGLAAAYDGLAVEL
jgi:phosphoribosyl 1,2-cyclic phosphate phosphodiesterase